MAPLPEEFQILPTDSPYVGAIKVALAAQERKRLSGVEQKRAEELRKADPTQHFLRCQVCGCWMRVKTTKKKDSFTAGCPLCRLRLFFKLDVWLDRDRLRKAAGVMNQ